MLWKKFYCFGVNVCQGDQFVYCWMWLIKLELSLIEWPSEESIAINIVSAWVEVWIMTIRTRGSFNVVYTAHLYGQLMATDINTWGEQYLVRRLLAQIILFLWLMASTANMLADFSNTVSSSVLILVGLVRYVGKLIFCCFPDLNYTFGFFILIFLLWWSRSSRRTTIVI